jgi:MtN3 and saliva related transmembrane protein
LPMFLLTKTICANASIGLSRNKSMDLETLIGIGASVFSASSLIPQLIKILKEKKAEDISLLMLAVLFTGLALWVWYGFLQDDLIITISNSFALLINLVIGILAIRYKNKKS